MDPNYWMFGGYMLEEDRLEAEEDEGYHEASGSSFAGWVIVGIVFFVLVLLLR